jgi:hypothetical protein
MRSLILPRPFASRYGVPVIGRVDPRIFTSRYFTHCLHCGFCHDWCCSFGVDVDLRAAGALERHAEALERYTGIGRERWLEPEVERDAEMPGGGSRRTRVEHGACVFLNRAGRGCRLHAFCLDQGLDYHELKSLVDCLFPLTFSGDLLCPSDEVATGALVCLDRGPSVYRGLREEVRYYFGDECVAALDGLASAYETDNSAPTAGIRSTNRWSSTSSVSPMSNRTGARNSGPS